MSTLHRRRRRKSVPIKTKRRWRIYHGDMLRVLRRRHKLNHRLFDVVITDPPYNLASIVKRFGKTKLSDKNKTAERGRNRSDGYARLSRGFMSLRWDNQIAFQIQTWRRIYSCLKPGAYVIAMGGTRTSHRMTCAIEDAGFIIRDTFMWNYGSGFPKSHNIAKAIDKKFGGKYKKVPATGVGFMKPKGHNGWNPTKHKLIRKSKLNKIARRWRGYGTAVKPAYEPIIIAQKPVEGTIVNNVLTYGTGGMNIDACRIPYYMVNGGNLADNPQLRKSISGGNGGRIISHETNRRIIIPNNNGRWPANFIHDGSPEVLEIFASFGTRKAGAFVSNYNRPRQNRVYGKYNKVVPFGSYNDDGSVARFFYTAKVARKDRVYHCSRCKKLLLHPKIKQHQHGRVTKQNRPDFSHITSHPTVKPLNLMLHLVQLFTPPNGRILDPFAGTGTTLLAASQLGFRSVGIEQDKGYVRQIKYRLRQHGF